MLDHCPGVRPGTRRLHARIDSPTVLFAFSARLISCLSACCLPLVPGYLATVTGATPSGASKRVDLAVIGRSPRFIGTFSLLFILFEVLLQFLDRFGLNVFQGV